MVIGESIGNGYPMAAVVTSPTLAAPFDAGVDGSPVACAAALAVLGVMENEHLADSAMQTGKGLRDAVRALGLTVRGAGLCLEIDVPSAKDVAARLRDSRVLIATRANTLLFRPPLTFSAPDTSAFVEAVRSSL